MPSRSDVSALACRHCPPDQILELICKLLTDLRYRRQACGGLLVDGGEADERHDVYADSAGMNGIVILVRACQNPLGCRVIAIALFAGLGVRWQEWIGEEVLDLQRLTVRGACMSRLWVQTVHVLRRRGHRPQGSC